MTTAQVCGTCNFGRLHPNSEGLGCFRYPPTVQAIFSKHPATGQMRASSQLTLYPTVEPNQPPCGEYRARVILPGAADLELVAKGQS